MTNINFCGPFLSSSGYAEFARYFVAALYNQGESVSAELIPIDVKDVDYGKKGLLCKKLCSSKSKPDINIINMIPPLFAKYKKPGAINIGFTMWEAETLPPLWTKLCNEMDAIFVPCHWNKEVFENSGVTVPVLVVQPGIDTDDIPEVKDYARAEQFMFGSVFQWLERKNPAGLIRAYLSEFRHDEPVQLLLKTYLHNGHRNNNGYIAEQVAAIVKNTKLPAGRPPDIKIVTETLPHQAMDNLYRTMDCFALLSRGEGWGLPWMKAMLYEKPVIGPNYSGNTDFMTKSNSYLCDYVRTPVYNMAAIVPWYDGTMYWAEPSIHDCAKAMREVYENREASAIIAKQGREDIINQFTEENSVKQIRDAIAKLGKRKK